MGTKVKQERPACSMQCIARSYLNRSRVTPKHWFLTDQS